MAENSFGTCIENECYQCTECGSNVIRYEGHNRRRPLQCGRCNNRFYIWEAYQNW